MTNQIEGNTQYLIDGDTRFISTEDGEIFGIGGATEFVKNLQAAVRSLQAEPKAHSVTIRSHGTDEGHVISRA